MTKKCLALIALLLLVTPAMAGEFSLAFEWGDIPPCTSGRPNTVPNPRFVLENVPEGTKYLQFQMTDLDVPQYMHGGGTVEYSGQNIIDPGAFTYKSPCPPGSVHTYKWTVTAKAKNGLFGKKLGKASATKKYPE